MPAHPIVVIGASAGGVQPLLELAASLPADLPAALAVVLHIGRQPSILPELLASRGALPARHARDGEPLQAGTIYVAPPDEHLLLEDGAVRLSRGPRENHARPAIDPLFRTAALHYRERAIGVLLSGALDDGAAGLAAIKQSGGRAIVQDPATAFDPSMPLSALASLDVDHCLAPQAIGPTLCRLVAGAMPPAQPVPDRLRHEQAIFEGKHGVEHLDAIGDPCEQTCPDCGGTLWELHEKKPLRFRCHVGHAYSGQSLADSQARQTDEALQSSLRRLEEREMLLRRLVAVAEGTGDQAQAAAGRRQAQHLRRQLQVMRETVQQEPAA